MKKLKELSLEEAKQLSGGFCCIINPWHGLPPDYFKDRIIESPFIKKTKPFLIWY